jgi:hypothetical protein
MRRLGKMPLRFKKAITTHAMPAARIEQAQAEFSLNEIGNPKARPNQAEEEICAEHPDPHGGEKDIREEMCLLNIAPSTSG